MLALASIWIGLLSLLIAVAMAIYRPVFTDLTVTLVLYFGSPGSLCFSGLVLWAHRKEDGRLPGIRDQRLQAKIAIGLALLAAVIVYLLIFYSEKLSPIGR